MITLHTSRDADAGFMLICCNIKELPCVIAAPESDGTSAGPRPPAASLPGIMPGIMIEGHAAITLALEIIKPSPSLFPNGNIGMPLGLLHWRSQMLKTGTSATLCASTALIERQLSDGRPFLQGARAGLADAVSASWLLARRSQIKLNPALDDWLSRMKAMTKARPAAAPDTTAQITTDNVLERMRAEPLLHIRKHAGHEHTVTCALDE